MNLKNKPDEWEDKELWKVNTGISINSFLIK